MLGTLFGGLAMGYFGWRVMFIGLGFITLLWLWPWFLVTRSGDFDGPAEHDALSVSYATILGQREFWGAALGHFCINYSFYFVMTWLPTFLVKAGGFSLSEMAWIGAAIFGTYAVATALAGAASDRWIRRGGAVSRVRKTFALASGLGVAVTIACCAFVDPRAAVWPLGAGGRVLRPVDADDVCHGRDARGPSGRGPLGWRSECGRPAGGCHRAGRDRPHRRPHRGLLVGICRVGGGGRWGDAGMGRCHPAGGGGAVARGARTCGGRFGCRRTLTP